MNIIIVGCGKVGSTLAGQLSQEGHDISIIDINKVIIVLLTDNWLYNEMKILIIIYINNKSDFNKIDLNLFSLIYLFLLLFLDILINKLLKIKNDTIKISDINKDEVKLWDNMPLYMKFKSIIIIGNKLINLAFFMECLFIKSLSFLK